MIEQSIYQARLDGDCLRVGYRDKNSAALIPGLPCDPQRMQDTASPEQEEQRSHQNLLRNIRTVFPVFFPFLFSTRPKRVLRTTIFGDTHLKAEYR
jgi:hypothetical protein